jgi:hypothetical protein
VPTKYRLVYVQVIDGEVTVVSDVPAPAGDLETLKDNAKRLFGIARMNRDQAERPDATFLIGEEGRAVFGWSILDEFQKKFGATRL